MKIKTKKQLNLPQLIEWAWDNDVRGQLFPTDQNQEAGIYIATNRDLMMNNADYIKYNNTFTVEVEETVTEKTEFELLIEITDGYPNCLWEEASVEDWKDEDSKEFHAYIDGEFKLIWRDGKLVE
ncbi:hypothetical protein [Staphylococcus sp. ZWU0021]|uniref:hypothetical protein n=1 Tax=Staphylococcus sp. ZWU0021 TaxID=1339238 RepID=UPI000689654B|nr:hypothetical protein [Staphylococcus sp. ZWU0021]